MDSKEVLKRLLRIADNQQKIINKLAQSQSGAKTAPLQEVGKMVQTPQPRQHGSIGQEITTALEATHPELAPMVYDAQTNMGVLTIYLQPGSKNVQALQQAVQSIVSDLEKQNLFMRGHKIKYEWADPGNMAGNIPDLPAFAGRRSTRTAKATRAPGIARTKPKCPR